MYVSKRVFRLGWLVLAAGMVALCASSVVAAVRTVFSDPGIREADVSEPVLPARPAQPPREMFAALAASPVFGALSEAPKPTAAPPPIAESLPETTLKLRLVGAVTGPPEGSYAIIENQSTRTQKTYRMGEVIVPGATLEAIYDQRVVIVRNGRREQLTMHQAATAVPLSAASGTRVTSAAPLRSAPSPAAPNPVADSVAAGGDSGAATAIRRINDNLRVIDREQFQREHGSDVLQTINSVYAEPRVVAGQPSGILLRDLGRGESLAQLGFAMGDVVVSVNGKRVNSTQDLAALNDFLNSASDIRVQIIRNNLPRTLIFKVR